jgi:hypothetical protein
MNQQITADAAGSRLREIASALRRGVDRQVASTAGHNVPSTAPAGLGGTSLVPSREIAGRRPAQENASWPPSRNRRNAERFDQRPQLTTSAMCTDESVVNGRDSSGRAVSLALGRGHDALLLVVPKAQLPHLGCGRHLSNLAKIV